MEGALVGSTDGCPDGCPDGVHVMFICSEGIDVGMVVGELVASMSW
jgi:hypothetical protein